MNAMQQRSLPTLARRQDFLGMVQGRRGGGEGEGGGIMCLPVRQRKWAREDLDGMNCTLSHLRRRCCVLCMTWCG